MPLLPTLAPLGAAALLVRFGAALSPAANLAAIAFGQRAAARPPPGVIEVSTTLVSVLLRYDPRQTEFARLAGEVQLLFSAEADEGSGQGRHHEIEARFGGEAGPDLPEVAAALGMTESAFVNIHNAAPLRVLAIGFAPGFAYCGFHPLALHLSRRTALRPRVPAGTLLFAAGQTAITATPVPTGWHVIGETSFRNFDPQANPAVTLRPGETVSFVGKRG